MFLIVRTTELSTVYWRLQHSNILFVQLRNIADRRLFNALALLFITRFTVSWRNVC